MTIYKCTRCLKDFSKKYNYEVHINRKYKCKEKNDKNESVLDFRDETMDSNIKHFCKGCNTSFSTRSNLLRHQKRKNCLLVIELQTKNNKLSLENEKLQERLNNVDDDVNNMKNKMVEIEKKLESNPSGGISNNTVNSHNNNTIINIVNFGHEDFDKLSRPELIKVINAKYGALRNYVEFTHLNNRIPEQKNVKITNMRSNDCQVVENDRWVTKNVNEVIDEIINNGVNNIENYLDDHDIKLSGDKLEKLRDLLDNIQQNKNSKITKNTKLEIKRLLYDNKDKVK